MPFFSCCTDTLLWNQWKLWLITNRKWGIILASTCQTAKINEHCRCWNVSLFLASHHCVGSISKWAKHPLWRLEIQVPKDFSFFPSFSLNFFLSKSLHLLTSIVCCSIQSYGKFQKRCESRATFCIFCKKSIKMECLVHSAIWFIRLQGWYNMMLLRKRSHKNQWLWELYMIW